jgi:hypothetical protein
MPMELSERDLQLRAEYRRELDEQFERTKKTGFKNGAEALEALRDLFGSEQELEEFGRYIRRMREEERARTGPQ